MESLLGCNQSYACSSSRVTSNQLGLPAYIAIQMEDPAVVSSYPLDFRSIMGSDSSFTSSCFDCAHLTEPSLSQCASSTAKVRTLDAGNRVDAWSTQYLYRPLDQNQRCPCDPSLLVSFSRLDTDNCACPEPCTACLLRARSNNHTSLETCTRQTSACCASLPC